MQKLRIKMEHCYGIKNLQREFDFSSRQAVAIYAPNGAMKSSFAQTFQDHSLQRNSTDRFYPKKTTIREITDETGKELNPDSVFVITPYESEFEPNERTSVLLVNGKLKLDYTKLVGDLENAKQNLVRSLAKLVGKKVNVEEEISQTFTNAPDRFARALISALDQVKKLKDVGLATVPYSLVFDESAIKFLVTTIYKQQFLNM